MRLGQSIRSDLIPNREARPSSRKRIHDAAFGLYRPLTLESTDVVQKVLTEAKVEVDEFLARRHSEPATMVIPDEHGVTYVEKGRVVNALKKGALRQFEVVRMEQGIDRYNGTTDGRLEVPIDNFDWCGGNLRKLAGFFDGSNACTELAEDTEAIDELFQDAGTDVLAASEPDHVSLCRYRGPRNRFVRQRHRDEISGIVERHFGEYNVGSIVLGRLAMGHSYSTPL